MIELRKGIRKLLDKGRVPRRLRGTFQCLLFAVLITACTTKHWAKPGATQEDFTRDSYACVQQSRQSWIETRPSPFGPGGDDRGVNKTVYRLCMESRGYQRTDDGRWVGVRD